MDAVYAGLVGLTFAALERVAASDAKHGDRLLGENYAYFVEVGVWGAGVGWGRGLGVGFGGAGYFPMHILMQHRMLRSIPISTHTSVGT